MSLSAKYLLTKTKRERFSLKKQMAHTQGFVELVEMPSRTKNSLSWSSWGLSLSLSHHIGCLALHCIFRNNTITDLINGGVTDLIHIRLLYTCRHVIFRVATFNSQPHFFLLDIVYLANYLFYLCIVYWNEHILYVRLTTLLHNTVKSRYFFPKRWIIRCLW